LEWLGNRLEQQGEQIMSHVDRHCNQALQKLRNELRSELIAWCGDAFVQFRAEVASAERLDDSRGRRTPEVLSQDMLAAVQRGMVVAQRSISEVKESLLMVLNGHSGAKREVEELHLSIKLIADRVSTQEAAVSSVQKDMDQVCSSLQERIDKAETSSQRVTGLFQELRKDMARLLAEEPKVDSVNLEAEVVEAPDRQRSTGSDLSQETISQSCFRPWSRRFEAADVDKVVSMPSEQHEGSGSQEKVDAAVESSQVETPPADVEMQPAPKSEAAAAFEDTWPADPGPSPLIAEAEQTEQPELPAEVEKVEEAKSEPVNFAAPVIKAEEDEAQSVSSSSSMSKDGHVEEKPALQAVASKGASNQRRRSFELTLVDSDGEYDDDEFEDDDDPIEIKSSRRSSLKSQE